MAPPDAGKPSLGGPAENEGTKGYAPDDTPLRDGHVQEPDVLSAPELGEGDALTGERPRDTDQDA
jgi:hypothetical protein